MNLLICSKHFSSPSIVGRLDGVGEGPVARRVGALGLDRDDLDRDVPGGGIELEVVEHRPAEDVGQEDVEGDRGRLELAGQRKRRVAAVGDDPLESLAPGEVEQDCGVVGVVLDDEDDRVARLDALAVVVELSSRRRPEHGRWRARGAASPALSAGRAG